MREHQKTGTAAVQAIEEVTAKAVGYTLKKFFTADECEEADLAADVIRVLADRYFPGVTLTEDWLML